MVNEYHHEDAIKDANLYAGAKTNISEALKGATSKQLASQIIHDAQKTYLDLFEAFISGVDWARKNPPNESARGE